MRSNAGMHDQTQRNSLVGGAAEPCCQTLPRLWNGALQMPSFATASASTALRTSIWVAESCRGLLLSASRRNSSSPATGSNIYVTLEGSSTVASAIRTLGSHSVATPHVEVSMFLDCLVCPQRGFVLKFVPSSQIDPQRRQGVGIGMVRALTLSRHPAGLHRGRRKRRGINMFFKSRVRHRLTLRRRRSFYVRTDAWRCHGH